MDQKPYKRKGICIRFYLRTSLNREKFFRRVFKLKGKVVNEIRFDEDGDQNRMTVMFSFIEKI
jgi:hypothetical protein